MFDCGVKNWKFNCLVVSGNLESRCQMFNGDVISTLRIKVKVSSLILGNAN